MFDWIRRKEPVRRNNMAFVSSLQEYNKWSKVKNNLSGTTEFNASRIRSTIWLAQSELNSITECVIMWSSSTIPQRSCQRLTFCSTRFLPPCEGGTVHGQVTVSIFAYRTESLNLPRVGCCAQHTHTLYWPELRNLCPHVADNSWYSRSCVFYNLYSEQMSLNVISRISDS
ncbi:hypothetical protein J6590_038569 [Homalodisca vitripennis]|nr:hypothetical protein J6590_038569 [Homalodisca vitripennis]